MARRILLVEDDRVSRESLTALLGTSGYQVLKAWSAEEARAGLDLFRPDVALLDIRLPGMWGDAFATHLRKIYPDLPVIFISAEFERPTGFTEEAGFWFMKKPLDVARLFAILDEATARTGKAVKTP
jgi:DNA-binding response OmpR family regulator